MSQGPQRSRADTPGTPHDLFLGAQHVMTSVIENQDRLLEQMETITSNQNKVEKGLEKIKTMVFQLSKAVEDWERKTGRGGGMEACKE